LKTQFRATFDIKLYGNLTAFIGWHISRSDAGIAVNQETYAKSLLERYGMRDCNHAWTPLTLNADLVPAYNNEALL